MHFPTADVFASEPPAPKSFFRHPSAQRLLVLLALALVLGAMGLRRIALANTDVESLPQLAVDAALLTPSTSAANAWKDHDFGLHAWKSGAIKLTGQIDSRVLHLGALAPHVAAAVALFLIAAPGMGGFSAALFALGIAAVFETPAMARVLPAEDSAGGSWWLLLAMLQLGLMSRAKTGDTRWWFGVAMGALNILAASEGIVPAIALFSWGMLQRKNPDRAARLPTATVVANGLLTLVGVVLILIRSNAATDTLASGSAAAPLFPWPLNNPFLATIAWAPAGVCLVQAWRNRHTASPALRQFSLPAWTFALAAVVLLLRPHAPTATNEILGGAVLINAACFAALPGETRRARTRNLLLFTVWLIIIGDRLVNPPPSPERRAIPPDGEVAAAVRSVLSTGATAPAGIVFSPEENRALQDLIRNGSTRALLPASIRAALPVVRRDETKSPGFRDDGFPSLPLRDDLPAFGTWTPDAKGEGRGEFISAELRTPFPLLQVRIAGKLNPPDTSIVLRTPDGTEIPPLTRTLSADDKWRRINFAPPEGPFQLVARDTSASDWLAFTGPVETNNVSRLAAKIPRAWPWLLTLGLTLGCGLALLVWRRAAAHPGHRLATGDLLDWRVVPWIALGSYAVFFCHHLDTVAGPNDSGGYLNLAKTLASGHLTAEPRKVFAVTGDSTDITPYLTTTFQPHSSGRMMAEYPVGFPLEVAAFAQVLPLHLAVPAVMLLQLVLGVWFTRQLAKGFGLADGWSWLAGGMVGLSAVYLFQGLQPQSDGPALVWVTAALYWAWSSRTRPRHAILAGLATTLAVLIRPSNLLCVLPVLLCLAGRWRQIFWWALAGLPGAIFLGWYNHELYGSWHRTGYGDIGASFGLHFIPATLRSYAMWLPEFFTPLLLLGLAAPFVRSIPGRVRLVLTGWALAFFAFYACYWCTWDNWYNMRFVLPAMPALLVLALLVLHRICARFRLPVFENGPVAKTLVPTALVVVAIFAWQIVPSIQRRVLYWIHASEQNSSSAEWLKANAPANAVVFAKHGANAVWHYTDLAIVRLDHPLVHESAEVFRRLREAGHPVYALTYHFEERGFKSDGDNRGTGYPDLPGTWERVAALWEKEIYIWKQTALPEAR